MDKKYKIFILIFIILIVAGIATHLFLNSSISINSGSKNITDAVGRNVEIPNTINKIVSTSPPNDYCSLYDCSGQIGCC